jgi:Carboxypeptidase regulatory-like domain
MSRYCLSVLFFSGILFAQIADQAGVSGVVRNRSTERPIAGAFVELTDARGLIRTTTSDSDGRFFFRRLGAGTYQIRSGKGGFADSKTLHLLQSGAQKEIGLGTNQQVQDASVLLTEAGSISGRIADNRGRPIANARVAASRREFRGGRISTLIAQEVLSNDLGMYRLFWLTPGQYEVSVRVPDGPMGVVLRMSPEGNDSRGLYEGRAQVGPVSVLPVGSGAGPNEAFVPIYYPGVAARDRARWLNLLPGSELTGIDITAAPVVTKSIGGLARVNSSTQFALERLQIRLLPLSPGPGVPGYTAKVDPNSGRFSVEKVVQGEYVLVGSVGGDDGPKGFVRVSVEERPLDNLVVELRDRVTINFRIRPDVPERNVDFSGLSIVLRPNFPSDAVPTPAGDLSTDGNASLSAYPGTYRVEVSPKRGVPSSADMGRFFTKMVRTLRQESLGNAISLDSDAGSGVEIILGTRPGSIRGRVMDGSGKPLEASNVLLIPTMRLEPMSDAIKSGVTDKTGQFQIDGVYPGSYYALAMGDSDQLLGIIEGGQTEVEVAEGEVAVVVLRPGSLR